MTQVDTLLSQAESAKGRARLDLLKLAVSKLNSSLKTTPNDVNLLFQYANTLFLLSQSHYCPVKNKLLILHDAIEKYKLLLKLDPFSETKFNLAQSLSSLYELNDDISLLHEANSILELLLSSDQSLDYFMSHCHVLNSLFNETNDSRFIQSAFQKLELSYQVFLEFTSEREIMHATLLTSKNDLNLLRQALNLLENVLSIEPDNVQALCDSGDVCQTIGHLLSNTESIQFYQTALNKFTVALSIDNTDSISAQIATINANLFAVTNCLDYLDVAISIFNRIPDQQVKLAVCSSWKGDLSYRGMDHEDLMDACGDLRLTLN